MTTELTQLKAQLTGRYELGRGGMATVYRARDTRHGRDVAIKVLRPEIALDAGRLFRRTFAVTTILFIALIYWNHEAWIARRNIDRFATTGKLDVAYLARDLSPNAIPAIAERLPSLPEPTQSALRDSVRTRYAPRQDMREGRWYEWNLGRAKARQALTSTFGITSLVAASAPR